MRRQIAGSLLALFAWSAAHSQAANQALTFEVATVKPASPRKEGDRRTLGCYGGPGSPGPSPPGVDPLRFTCEASVSLMALYAYDLKLYELRPAVSTDTNQFNIEARVSSGATAEQVKVMLRNLLAERFNLAFHREKAEIEGYALIVAESGLKMKESVPDSSPVSGEVGTPPVPGPIKDADGFVYIPIRNAMAVSTANGPTGWVGTNVPVDTQARDIEARLSSGATAEQVKVTLRNLRGARLTGLLDSATGRPVIDATGLKGKYHFILTFSSDSVGQSGPAPAPSDDRGIIPSGDGGLTVFGALEKQLGLKLEPRKIMVDLFVIDHAEKTPVEN